MATGKCNEPPQFWRLIARGEGSTLKDESAEFKPVLVKELDAFTRPAQIASSDKAENVRKGEPVQASTRSNANSRGCRTLVSTSSVSEMLLHAMRVRSGHATNALFYLRRQRGGRRT